MIRSLKEIRKELKNRRGEHERLKDEDGRVIVDFCVHSDDEFLSPYSLRTKAELSPSVAEFVERSLDGVPVNEQVRLRVHSDVITDEEEKTYTEAIHQYYTARFESVRHEKKRIVVIALLMAIIGVIALSFIIGLELTGSNLPIVGEVIDIFAWVFLWETVDLLCFELTALRIKSWRYLALSACVIEYLPLANKEKDV